MVRQVMKLLAIILVSCAPLYAVAWNAEGHKLIAQIAYNNLTPRARNHVDELVKAFQKDYPDKTTFISIAPWPDELRGQKITMYTHWHYIDNAFSDDGTPLKKLNDTDNVEWAINGIKPILKSEATTPIEKSRFLAFFIHIVGDLHHPLHAVSRISMSHPDGDQGGNLFFLDAAKTKNLHALWDNGLGIFEEQPYDKMSEKITALYPESYFGNMATDLNEQDWEKEDMQLATAVVYKTSEFHTPNNQYMVSGQDIVKQRIALAGYRLAHLLNVLLG